MRAATRVACIMCARNGNIQGCMPRIKSTAATIHAADGV
jgi:hypothetical protein